MTSTVVMEARNALFMRGKTFKIGEYKEAFRFRLVFIIRKPGAPNVFDFVPAILALCSRSLG